MSKLLPKQKIFIQNLKAKYPAFIGGKGCGKTHVGCEKAIELSLINPLTAGIVVAPTYQMLMDINVRSLRALLDSYKIRYIWKAQEKKILFDKNEIWFRSGDDPEKLKGPNLAWAWLDEAGSMVKDVWNEVISRIRDPKAKVLQAYVTSTPEGWNWLADLYYKPADDRFFVVKASTEENFHITNDYAEDLRSLYDEKMQRQYLDGEFVDITTGRVYYGFDREKHLTEQDFDYSYPLIVCCDFNINPCGWVLCQFIDNKIYILDELTVFNANTNVMCETLKEKGIENYPALLFYGDYTSVSQRSTASGYSDWQIIDSHFKNYRNYKKKLKANPKVKDSVNLINGLFSKDRIFINKRCVDTVKDCEKVVWSENKFEIEKKKNPDRTHWMDGVRYYVSCEFNINPTRSQII